MIYEISDFVGCVEGRLDPVPWMELTRQTIRVMDEIRRQNDITFPGVALIGE